jgi:hypothetical protein
MLNLKPNRPINQPNLTTSKKSKRKDFLWSFLATLFVCIIITLWMEHSLRQYLFHYFIYSLSLILIILLIISIFKKRCMVSLGIVVGAVTGFIFYLFVTTPLWSLLVLYFILLVNSK